MSQGEDIQHNCCAVNANKHFFLTSVAFKVDNEVFQLPRFLFPTSETFISRYPSFSYDSNSQIPLYDCTSEQFEALLTVIFQPLKYIFPSNHPLHQPLHLDLILSALEVATKWGFQDTQDDLQDKASRLIPTAFQKITLGKKYKMFSWFREGLEELVASDGDIGLDDANVIGMGFALRVYHARSRYTRGRSATSEVPEIDCLENAIQQVFTADLESFNVLPEDHVEETRMLVHVEEALPQEGHTPLVGNDRSPSVVSVTAELNSSTVVSDEHEVEVPNEHHDYSTDGEYYTRPPSLSTDLAECSVFTEDSVLSDAPSFGETAEEVVVIKPTDNEHDVIVVQTTVIHPIDPAPTKDEEVTTPRPTTDSHVPSASSPLPPPPLLEFRKASAPAVLIPVAQSPAGVSPENTQTPVATPPVTSTPPSVKKPSTKVTPTTPKASSSGTTTASGRDDTLIRDVLRCILDPTLPMPARIPTKVPKTCTLPSDDCGSFLRCDPCCLREARNYRSHGWIPKAKTPRGQVFLDSHLNGLTGGLGTLKETLQYIPKTCKKSGKNCGEKKRCPACCKAGMKDMMAKGVIV